MLQFLDIQFQGQIIEFKVSINNYQMPTKSFNEIDIIPIS